MMHEVTMNGRHDNQINPREILTTAIRWTMIRRQSQRTGDKLRCRRALRFLLDQTLLLAHAGVWLRSENRHSPREGVRVVLC